MAHFILKFFKLTFVISECNVRNGDSITYFMTSSNSVFLTSIYKQIMSPTKLSAKENFNIKCAIVSVVFFSILG